MTKPPEYRRDEHCVYLTDYHLVLPTKYRHPVITDELWKYLYGKLLEITQCNALTVLRYRLSLLLTL